MGERPTDVTIKSRGGGGRKGVTIYTYPDGTIIKKTGDIPYRNNNPGGLNFTGPNAKANAAAAGAMKIDEKTGSAIFPDYESGKRAADAPWERAVREGQTIEQVVRKYMSGSPPEAIEKRLREIENKMGVSRNVSPKQMERSHVNALEDYNCQLEGEINARRSGETETIPASHHGEQQGPSTQTGYDPAPAPPQPSPPAGRPRSSLEPGRERPGEPAGGPDGSRVADASPSAGAANAPTVQQMNYRDTGDSRYNPYGNSFDYGFYPHKPDPGRAQPGYAGDWADPDPGFSRSIRPFQPAPMTGDDWDSYDPGRRIPPRWKLKPLPFRYGIDDPGHIENYGSRDFGAEPAMQRSNYLAPDRSAPIDADRKPYTVNDALDFLGEVHNEAKPVSERTGLSLPFILGHAAHETGWGKSVPGNNLFGLPAGRDWRGPTVKVDDLVYRTYPSYKDSIEDYIGYLRGTPGYGEMFEPGTRDNPQRLAEAIQQGGYRDNDPLYARKIMFAADHPLTSHVAQYGAWSPEEL